MPAPILSPSSRQAFMRGFSAMSTPSIAIATWGLVTGVAMAKVLTIPQAIGMSLMVFSGSAQLAALPLILANMPVWTILFTTAMANLRFIFFSAAMQPHFGHLPLARRLFLGYLVGDVHFMLFIQRYPPIEPTQQASSSEREAFYYGLSFGNWLAWQSASIVGILLAQHIPTSWDVGFAGTLALLAIAIPLLADRAGVAATLSAVVISLAGMHWPYRLNLVAAVIAAVVVGLLVDRFASKRTSNPAAPNAEVE